MTIEVVNHHYRSGTDHQCVQQKVLANTAQWSALVYGMSNRIEYE